MINKKNVKISLILLHYYFKSIIHRLKNSIFIIHYPKQLNFILNLVKYLMHNLSTRYSFQYFSENLYNFLL